MTKRSVKAALGFKKDSDLARFFGISRGAVWCWKDDEPIPELRRLQLGVKRPDLCGEGSEAARAA